MRGNGCFGFSHEQQTEIWVRWKNGDSLSDIGRALRKHPGSELALLKKDDHNPIYPWKKEKKYHEALLQVRQYVILLYVLIVLHQRYPEKLIGMEAQKIIEQM